MDAVIEDENRTFFVDVTCPSTTAKSHQPNRAEREKKKSYLSAAEECGAELVVFQVDALGGFSRAANRVCNLITRSHEEYMELKTKISWTTWTSNGAMYSKLLRFFRTPPRAATTIPNSGGEQSSAAYLVTPPSTGGHDPCQAAHLVPLPGRGTGEEA
jgi:hypothetical protein